MLQEVYIRRFFTGVPNLRNVTSCGLRLKSMVLTPSNSHIFDPKGWEFRPVNRRVTIYKWGTCKMQNKKSFVKNLIYSENSCTFASRNKRK